VNGEDTWHGDRRLRVLYDHGRLAGLTWIY
jgi:hypothetical protein